MSQPPLSFHEWKNNGDWVKRSMFYEVESVRGQQRPRITWNQVVEKDMRCTRLGKMERTNVGNPITMMNCSNLANTDAAVLPN